MRKPTLSLLAVVLSTACGPQLAVPGPQEQSRRHDDLEPLNLELSMHTMQQALAKRSHFAPLCDENGFPLVGNINSKGDLATASGFCAEQRRK